MSFDRQIGGNPYGGKSQRKMLEEENNRKNTRERQKTYSDSVKAQ